MEDYQSEKLFEKRLKILEGKRTVGLNAGLQSLDIFTHVNNFMTSITTRISSFCQSQRIIFKNTSPFTNSSLAYAIVVVCA